MICESGHTAVLRGETGNDQRWQAILSPEAWSGLVADRPGKAGANMHRVDDFESGSLNLAPTSLRLPHRKLDT